MTNKLGSSNPNRIKKHRIIKGDYMTQVQCSICSNPYEEKSNMADTHPKLCKYCVETLNEESKKENSKTVRVVDFDMKFSSMIIFMVKWAIASIPAMIILIFCCSLLMSVFGITLSKLINSF